MNAARVRIGRVRMKGGGADVRVLPSSDCGLAMGKLRGWVARITEAGHRPDAITATAYVWNEKDRRWSEWCTWYSAHPSLPPSVLPAMAEASLREGIAAIGIEDSIMRTLGYDPDAAS